jgi:hypothetical protein
VADDGRPETFPPNMTEETSEPIEAPVIDLESIRIETTEPIAETKPNSRASKDRPRLGAWGGRNRGSGEAPKEPPRRGRPPKAKPTIPAYKAGMFVQPLTDMYTGVGMMLTPFDQVCAKAVIDNAEQCARSLDQLARTNESVRRVLFGMMQTGAWGAVLVAHLPIIMAVAAHHSPVLRERSPFPIPEFDATVGAKAAQNGSAA